MKNGKRVEAKQLYLQAKEYLVLTNELTMAKDEVFKTESKLRSLKLAMAESYYGAGYNGQLVVVDQVTIECDCEGDPSIRFIEDWVTGNESNESNESNDPIYDPKIVAAVYREQALKKELETNGNP
jgi:hypothetical protein